MEVSAAPPTESLRLVGFARKHNPSVYNPLNGILESRDGHPFPVFIAKDQAARVDAEGNEFIDYTMGWGSTILATPTIASRTRCASHSRPARCCRFRIRSRWTSRLLLDEFPGNDMVVFGKNGSDVCTIAARWRAS